MFGFNKTLSWKLPFTVTLLLSLISCGGSSSWNDIAVLDIRSGKIQAGDAVRIEPSAFETVEFSSTELSIKKFKFNGTRTDSSENLELFPTVTVMAGEGNFGSVETQSTEETIQWAVGEPQKAITIVFMNMQRGSSYSGKGHLYFYMTDKDKNCVSNIVAWPVAFKK